jgi:hypothetical protein
VAVVATVVDEFFGGGEVGLRGFPRVRFLAEEEAGAVKVDISRYELHGIELGNLPSFVNMTSRGVEVISKALELCGR